jgi:hypothetical protein
MATTDRKPTYLYTVRDRGLLDRLNRELARLEAKGENLLFADLKRIAEIHETIRKIHIRNNR